MAASKSSPRGIGSCLLPNIEMLRGTHNPSPLRATDEPANLGAAHTMERASMKIYMSVDIEGVAGVVDRSHGSLTGGAEYDLGRRLMTLETNAAIEGALEAGATEIVVNDSHGPMINLLPEMLHPKATLIQGRLKHLFMVEGLDDSFDGMFLVGYHASAGIRDGVLNHAF